MLKATWSPRTKRHLAYDEKDIFNQKDGISEANAIARVKYAADRTGFKLTKADIEAMKAACTPDLSSLKKK